MKHSTVIANGKGGVGKSTFANQLVAIITEALNVGHDRTANLSFINAKRAETSKTQSIQPLESPLFESFQKSFDENGNMKEEENFEMIWEHIKESLDGNVIFDLGGYDSPDHRVIYANADTIIIPTGLSLIDTQSLETMNHTLKQVSEQAERKIVAKVLPCRIHHNTKKTGKAYRDLVEEVTRLEHLELMDSIVYERADYIKALNKGCSVFELKSTSGGRATREIKSVVAELNLPTKFNK